MGDFIFQNRFEGRDDLCNQISVLFFGACKPSHGKHDCKNVRKPLQCQITAFASLASILPNNSRSGLTTTFGTVEGAMLYKFRSKHGDRVERSHLDKRGRGGSSKSGVLFAGRAFDVAAA
jgi:hypothetical protein